VPRGGRCLEARFNPVAVRGEISGFSRAASGHCYFSIKDAAGQIRCAMFRRAASCWFRRAMANWSKCAGVWAYEQRGDLQLVVESMQRAGQGLCSSSSCASRPSWRARACSTRRKRPLPPLPRGIGLVTSPARRRCTMW
jgi:exodeoxyribonuclease VII large subunit